MMTDVDVATKTAAADFGARGRGGRGEEGDFAAIAAAFRERKEKVAHART